MKNKYVLSLNEKEDLTKYKVNSEKQKKKNNFIFQCNLHSNWNADMNCNEETEFK